MIAFLNGLVAGRGASSVVLDVNGVGYEVFMGGSDLARLPEVGCRASIFTYLQVRDDGMALFGFLTQAEKELFLSLIGVTGIGPKVALAALSFYAPDQLVEAIASEDVARVSKIPGIGKKTAQRLILELKGSLASASAPTLFGAGSDAGAMGAGDAGTAGADDALAVARDALLSMGFTGAETDLALKGAEPGADESALLQYALRKLGSR